MEKIVSAVFDTAERLGIRLMLVGAEARNFWLEHFDVRANVRTTHDVDLACLVAAWEGYDRLLSTLTNEGGLLPDPRGIRHRLWLADEISVDIVPFGGVEDECGEFAWPPKFERTVNVLGFTAAFDDALETTIGVARLRIIRPCWLAFLKLNAYTDNQERTKDLKDLYFLTDNYLDLIDADRLLYEPNAPDADILSTDDFDVRIVGARLIARHCRRSEIKTATALQEHIRTFNAQGGLTDTFAIQNGISTNLARSILDALLEGVHSPLS
ncbi:MAG: hypothetical protein ACI4WT_13545 [Oligosphaeraceae bacterium]